MDTKPRAGSASLRRQSLSVATSVAICAALGVAATTATPTFAQSPSFLTTQASAADPLDIARDYLRSGAQGLTASDVDALTVTDRYRSTHNGVTHLQLRQQWRGIPVVNATLAVNVTADGRLVNTAGRLVSDLATNAALDTPSLDAERAVRAAASHLGLQANAPLEAQGPQAASATRDVRFNGAGISLQDIPATLAYYAVEDAGARKARLAWQLDIRTPDQRDWWVLWVDAANGEVLGKVNMIANDTYEVYPIPLVSPDEGPRTIEVDAAESTASPFGWHDTDGIAGAEFTDTRGNNVFAQEDRDANNSGGDRPDCGAGLDFQFPLDLNQEPDTYIPAATANLFYWNNIIHDILYAYGFDEASGNFQQNNYGRGGIAGDPVQADAQDGSGTNNANFSTPSDGSDPRMQMFVWTGGAANELDVQAGPAAGVYTATGAGFGPALDQSGIAGSLVIATDGTGDDVNDICEPVTNGAEIAGNIAVINRGTCSFVSKVRQAQQVGATGVVIVNNVSGSPITLGDDGTGGDIAIPSGMISLADGDVIKPTLPEAGVFRGGPPVVDRDSDLDAGVIVHEYGHGLSNRLTGGPSNVFCLGNTEQMGEGWSDWYAVAMTGKVGDTADMPRGVGTYLIYQPTDGTGIRSFPYSRSLEVNPFSYGDIATQSIPHGVGSVWATMLWDMYWNLVDEYGFDPDLYDGTGGNNLAIQLVTDGLKFQSCSPGFVDGRDAILLADQVNNGGANQCLIWDAFARRGLGVGASQGSVNSVTDGVESFDLPEECLGGNDGMTISAPTPGIAGVENCYDVSGATPGNAVRLLIGVQPGELQIPACDAPLEIGRPFPRGSAVADAEGNATLCTVVPAAVGGRSLLAQGLDLQAPGCDISNLDSTQF
ncbi:MAG: M36 family metallopeptidase [Pseudomonadota bacterium]